MSTWLTVNMGGEVPKTDPRLLADNQAEEAWNTDLTSGPLDGLPQLLLLHDMTAVPGVVQRAYRIPGELPTDADVWLPLPSPYSSVVRSPLTNDTLHRFYWTNPGAGALWNTRDRIRDGLPPYTLGFASPGNIPYVVPSGGTPTSTVPYVTRAYLFTYVDEYGLESSPSPPSNPVAGASDGRWDVLIPNPNAILTPAGKVYPNVVGLRLYRTVSGQNTGAQFYRIGDFPMTGHYNTGTIYPDFTYNDTVPDTAVVAHLPLESTGWLSPPDGLEGLTAMPSGFMVGFTGSTLHFCEPNRPHAWPAAYDVSVQYNIVGLGMWNQTLVVLTAGFPSSCTGTSPAAITVSQVKVAEPCIARGSIITDLLGVYYASQNGLVMLTYAGMMNQTLATMTKNIWLTRFRARSIIACRHRSQYLALNDTAHGLGFMIDYSDQRMGVVELDTFGAADCIWNDPYTGDAYIMAGKKVYRWDDPDTPQMTWRWRSKVRVDPLPLNFANIIALPLLLGVGVSFNIYFVMNWRRGVVAHLSSPTARAVVFSALTTGTAFGSLALSRHPGTASMGTLLLISLGCTLVASLIFVPALLALVSPSRSGV